MDTGRVPVYSLSPATSPRVGAREPDADGCVDQGVRVVRGSTRARPSPTSLARGPPPQAGDISRGTGSTCSSAVPADVRQGRLPRRPSPRAGGRSTSRRSATWRTSRTPRSIRPPVTRSSAPASGALTSTWANGSLVRRLAMGGPLNAPWGLVRAPHELRAFGGDILVGNFGDGRITASSSTGYWRNRLQPGNGSTACRSGDHGLRACGSATPPSAATTGWCSAPARMTSSTACSACSGRPRSPSGTHVV